MTQYNLRSLPACDNVAMNAGVDLDENEEFHNIFDFPPVTVPPGTSQRNSSSQSFTLLASNRGANGWKDEIAELTAAYFLVGSLLHHYFVYLIWVNSQENDFMNTCVGWMAISDRLESARPALHMSVKCGFIFLYNCVS